MYAPSGLIKECYGEPVKEGAKTMEELLQYVSEAYVQTLENLSKCNVKTREAINFVEAAKAEHSK